MFIQEEKLVAYMSQTLSEQAQNKSVYGKEIMVVVLAVQKWKNLLGRKTFERSQTKKVSNSRLRRGLSEIRNKGGSKS